MKHEGVRFCNTKTVPARSASKNETHPLLALRA